MNDTDDDKLLSGPDEEKPFGPNEEKAIISLAFDLPEFFMQVGRYMSYKFFQKLEHQYVYAIIEKQFKLHGTVPTRPLVLDLAQHDLKTDYDWEPIIDTINRKSNYRDIPIIKKTLLDWTKKKAFGILFTDEAHQAYVREDYQSLEGLFEKARRITDITNIGVSFFDNIQMLFQPQVEEKLTTGFPGLDIYVNDGGPTRGEVFVWMAPTGVGKSIMLVHSGKVSVEKNLKVLHVTLELSILKTMQRYTGSFTNEAIAGFMVNQESVEEKIHKIQYSTQGDLHIAYFPAGEITVDTIYQLIDNLKRTRNWKPDVLILDYLELMKPRSAVDDDKDYGKQKEVATELRALATKENLLVFTATQTNRDGVGGKGEQKDTNGGSLIGLNKVAESFGKMMPIDYCVSINQTEDEYKCDVPKVRLYITKNRNGQKDILIRASINYNTMHVTQEDFGA